VIGKYIKRESGFTLLELLIVIVVIGILALLIIPNLTSAPKKARDTQRKTDLRAVQKGLEEYFVSYSAYPAALDRSAGCSKRPRRVLRQLQCLPGGSNRADFR
jgi:type II secretion system protein G